jgi:hypothetical protein
MASWADIQDYLNRTGQNITQAGQGQINAAVDQPIADARQRAAMQARQAAMNQVAGNPVINPPRATRHSGSATKFSNYDSSRRAEPIECNDPGSSINATNCC